MMPTGDFLHKLKAGESGAIGETQDGSSLEFGSNGGLPTDNTGTRALVLHLGT